jgi:glycosyltransferase involved in cell wall biosynthesis
MSTVALTIAVPTYRRADAVLALMEDLLPWAWAAGVAVLVVDDGSTDDTWPRLQAIAAAGAGSTAGGPPEAGVAPGPRMLRNPENLGYARTFCRLVRETDTEWLLMAEDDGAVVREGVLRLLEWLADADTDFVSTQWFKPDGSLYRGRTETGPIQAREFRQAATHAPGLVYRVAAAKAALLLLEEHLARGSDAARIYPQVFVATESIARGRAMWWPGVVCRQSVKLASGITDEAGRAYSHPASRVAQVLAFDALFRDMQDRAPDKRYGRAAQDLRRQNGRSLYKTVRTAVLAENPRADADAYDAWMRAEACSEWIKQSLKRIPGVAGLARRIRRPRWPGGVRAGRR